jgi:hypothetical protein
MIVKALDQSPIAVEITDQEGKIEYYQRALLPGLSGPKRERCPGFTINILEFELLQRPLPQR